MPKFTALLIAIPAPVAAAYITVLIGMLFVQGMKIVIQDGVDHRKAVVVGLSFWIGTGFQNAWIIPDLLGDGFLGVLLGNGMTSGAIVAVILMVLIELTSPRRLVVTARTGVGGAELEFVSASEGGEPGRPAVVPGRDAGYTGQQGDIVSPAASLRVVGAPSEVSRRRHRYGQRRWVSLALDAWQFSQPYTRSRNGATH